MSIIRRRRKAILTIALLALATGGGAFAYFTATGTGSGTGTVGSASSLTVTGTVSGTLYPGTSDTVNFTANNPSSGHQRLGTITLSGMHACTAGGTYSGSTCSTGSEVTGCEDFDTGAGTHDFTMAPVTANQDLPSGNNQTVTTTGTLTMNDLASSQNTCQGVTLTLAFTLS